MLVEMQKEAFVTMWIENYQNTRIVNEHYIYNGVITHMYCNFNDLWDNKPIESHAFLYKCRCFYHPQWCFISISSVDACYL